MKIENKTDNEGGAFFIADDGKEVGLMHYVFPVPGKMIIDHTEVDEAYEGQGLGRELVNAGVEFARAEGMKILPYCQFAKKIFDITPEYNDVLF